MDFIKSKSVKYLYNFVFLLVKKHVITQKGIENFYKVIIIKFKSKNNSTWFFNLLLIFVYKITSIIIFKNKSIIWILNALLRLN
jgi:hypothetical protein